MLGIIKWLMRYLEFFINRSKSLNKLSGQVNQKMQAQEATRKIINTLEQVLEDDPDRYEILALALALSLIQLWFQAWLFGLLQSRLFGLLQSRYLEQSFEAIIHQKDELEMLLIMLEELPVNEFSTDEFRHTISLAIDSIMFAPINALLISYFRDNKVQEKVITTFANFSTDQEEIIAHYREFKCELIKQKRSQLSADLRLWQETFQLCKAVVRIRVQNLLHPNSQQTK